MSKRRKQGRSPSQRSHAAQSIRATRCMKFEYNAGENWYAYDDNTQVLLKMMYESMAMGCMDGPHPDGIVRFQSLENGNEYEIDLNTFLQTSLWTGYRRQVRAVIT